MNQVELSRSLLASCVLSPAEWHRKIVRTVTQTLLNGGALPDLVWILLLSAPCNQYPVCSVY